MEKFVQIATVGCLELAIAGCAFTPETMPMTQRDQAVYVDAGAVERGAETKVKVAVRASPGEYKQYDVVGKALASTLNDRLARFAFFDLVDHGAASAVLQEQAASAGDISEVSLKGIESDFVVVAKITSVTTRDTGVVSNGGKLTAIDVQFDFTWISMGESQKVILKRSITPKVNSVQSAGEVAGVLCRAAETAATEFSRAISSKYAPPARVLQTRGNGAAARINIGDDYGLTAGMEVEFYEIVDNSTLGGDARDSNLVARGTVKKVEPKAAWVKVADFEKVNVRKGVYVRITGRKDGGLGGKLVEETGVNELF